MPIVRLLLISRDDILGETGGDNGARLFRLLATLTRQGIHLLATAPQPEHWSGAHGSPDDALLGPESIRKRLADAGGKLDGVFYLRRSLFTQRRNREDALKDILQRYAAAPEGCTLLSSKRKFIQVANDLGINGVLLSREQSLLEALQALAGRLEQPPTE